MRILFVWPNLDTFGVKPIGLALLSSILKKKGHEVALFDTSFMDFGTTNNTDVLTNLGYFKPVDYGCDVSKRKVDLREEFTRKVEEFQPDVVGVSALSDEVDLGLKIASYARERNLPVIWGNKGAERLIKDGTVVAGGMVFLGECVETLPKMLEDFVNYPMIVHPEGYFKDLDQLPYLDWSIFDERHFLKAYDGKVYRGGDHMIGWGCTNSCAYCINEHWRELHGGMKGCLRRYEESRAIIELRSLKSIWGLEFFKFHDEDFLLKPINYLRDFAAQYAYYIDLPFTCMTNAKSVTPEKVELLKAMGCVSVSMGVETGNSLMRQLLRRRESPTDIIAAVGLLKDADIRVSAFNMIGLPFETVHTIKDTIALNRAAGIEHPNISFFIPLEGTKLYDLSVQYGFYDPSKKQDLRTDRPTLKLPEISEEELIFYYENFHSLVTGSDL